jgi:hypothetical protein
MDKIKMRLHEAEERADKLESRLQKGRYRLDVTRK